MDGFIITNLPSIYPFVDPVFRVSDKKDAVLLKIDERRVLVIFVSSEFRHKFTGFSLSLHRPIWIRA